MRPLEVNVPDLRPAGAGLLAVGLVGALDEAAVGGELLDAGEAGDVVDFVENGQGENLSDPADREEAEVGVGVVDLGGPDEGEFEIGDEPVVDGDELEIGLDGLADGRVGEGLGKTRAIRGVVDLHVELGEVVRGAEVLNVREELAALPDEVEPAAEKIARGPHIGRVDESLREHSTGQQFGDLEGIDPVVLDLPAVDGLHVEGVAQDEGDLFPVAEIGDPVPAEDALDGDGQVRPERLDRREQRLGRAGELAMEDHLTLRVEDADVHPAGMQVDSAA